MSRQSPLTLLGRITKDPARARASLLQQKRALSNQGSEVSALVQRGGIHFLSFLVIDPIAGDASSSPYVLLEISCDLSRAEMIARLVEHAPSFVDALFDQCEGYGASSSARRRFLKRIDSGADIYYLAFPGRSVEQLSAEAGLYARLRQRYRNLRGASWPGTASSAWKQLQEASAAEELVRGGAREPFFVRFTPHRGTLLTWAKPWLAIVALLVVLASAAAGLYGLAQLWGWSLLVALAGVLSLAAAALVSVLFVRHGPKSVGPRGRIFVLRSALWEWLCVLFGSLVAVGLVALVLTLHRWGPGWPDGLAAALPLAANVLYGVVVVLAFSAFLYVAYGTPAALTGCVLLGAGLVALIRYYGPAQGSLAAAIAIAALALAAYAAQRLLTWALALRRAEETDPNGELSWNVQHLDAIQEHEDLPNHGHQNHLATVSEIKHGPLRLHVLRMVLRTISLLARIYFTRGDLGGIRTIHHARFVIMPDHRRLLFLGNYDLGFSSYLQEFNRIEGVSAIWSNTVGFPHTFLLVNEGARDEQRFKAFARRCQVPTIGWYNAYPSLSVGDVEAAAATRADLRRAVANPLTFWGRQRMRFGRPLTEADCDAALRRL